VVGSGTVETDDPFVTFAAKVWVFFKISLVCFLFLFVICCSHVMQLHWLCNSRSSHSTGDVDSTKSYVCEFDVVLGVWGHAERLPGDFRRGNQQLGKATMPNSSSRGHISTSPHNPTASQAKSKDATQRELGCAAVGLGLQSGGAAAVAWAGHIPQTLVALLGTDAVVGVRKEASDNNNNKQQQTAPID
jgi:hypothetical protein